MGHRSHVAADRLDVGGLHHQTRHDLARVHAQELAGWEVGIQVQANTVTHICIRM